MSLAEQRAAEASRANGPRRRVAELRQRANRLARTGIDPRRSADLHMEADAIEQQYRAATRGLSARAISDLQRPTVLERAESRDRERRERATDVSVDEAKTTLRRAKSARDKAVAERVLDAAKARAERQEAARERSARERRQQLAAYRQRIDVSVANQRATAAALKATAEIAARDVERAQNDAERKSRAEAVRRTYEVAADLGAAYAYYREAVASVSLEQIALEDTLATMVDAFADTKPRVKPQPPIRTTKAFTMVSRATTTSTTRPWQHIVTLRADDNANDELEVTVDVAALIGRRDAVVNSLRPARIYTQADQDAARIVAMNYARSAYFHNE